VLMLLFPTQISFTNTTHKIQSYTHILSLVLTKLKPTPPYTISTSHTLCSTAALHMGHLSPTDPALTPSGCIRNPTPRTSSPTP
jgi:hypothetical protein